MAEQKKDPIFENFVDWLKANWSHVGLVVSIVIIISLVISLYVVGRRS